MDTRANKVNQAEQWYEQLRNRPSLTEEDAASYKDILLDYMDEFRAKGLREEEAFKIASMRLEVDSEIEEKCEMADSAVPLIRKILMVFSGIMVFLLLYNVLQFYLKLACYFSYQMKYSPYDVFQNNLYFIFCFHIIFILAVLLVLNFYTTIFRRFENIKIKPLYVLLLMTCDFTLAILDYQFRYKIRTDVPLTYQNLTGMAEMSLYSGYTFSLLAIVVFLSMLIKMIKPLKNKKKNNFSDSDHFIKMNYSLTYQQLINEGWKEMESIALIRMRNKISDNNFPDFTPSNEKHIKFSALLLSGSLVYLFLYYLLNSTSKIFLTVLQHVENDPVKNFSWMKWYIYSFYLLLIFFTTSLHAKDMNLLDRLKAINLLKPRRLFLFTVILCVTDCFFGAISKKYLGNIYELKVKLSDIIIFSDLVFPILLSICFFVLFAKYYKETNMVNG